MPEVKFGALFYFQFAFRSAGVMPLVGDRAWQRAGRPGFGFEYVVATVHGNVPGDYHWVGLKTWRPRMATCRPPTEARN